MRSLLSIQTGAETRKKIFHGRDGASNNSDFYFVYFEKMQIKIKRIRNIFKQKLFTQFSVLNFLLDEYNLICSQKLLYYSNKTKQEKMLRIHRKWNEMKIQAKKIEKFMKRYVFFGGDEFTSDLYDFLLEACKINKPK